MTAIIVWNTRYLDRTITVLLTIEPVPDDLLTHLSPPGWKHVSLVGDYIWTEAGEVIENHEGFMATEGRT